MVFGQNDTTDIIGDTKDLIKVEHTGKTSSDVEMKVINMQQELSEEMFQKEDLENEPQEPTAKP